MITNKDGFNILATLPEPIDCVFRYNETEKMEFPGYPFIETKLTERYGFQVIIGAYGEPGKWPITIQTEYTIERPRIEVAVPSASSLDFLKQLRRNVTEAIHQIESWERMKELR